MCDTAAATGKHARRRLTAAHGALARALVALDRTQKISSEGEPKRITKPRPRGDRPDLDDEEYEV